MKTVSVPKTISLLVLFMLALALPAHAEESPNPTVAIELPSGPIQLEAEVPGTLTVRVTVPEHHHGYLDSGKEGSFIPVAIDLSDLTHKGIRVEALARPEGEFESEVGATVFRHAGEFQYRLTLLPDATLGDGQYTLSIRSQICDDRNGSCYAPNTQTLPLTLAIGSLPTTAPPVVGSSIEPQARSEAPDENSSRGLITWMLLAFVAGLLLNVMPCVLPVVSIKVLSFVQQAGESKGRVLALGTMFGFGMLLVFEALALLAVVAGTGWGEQFQSATFLIVITAMVFTFALSLLGVFELRLPQQVSQLGAGVEREGLGDAFFKGMMATVLATPCSGPFLGSTLAWTLAQSPGTIFAVFTMLGLGMALPYTILTAFPKLLKLVPKPGPWMETFKHLMGFLLMATVVYLLFSLDVTNLRYTLVLFVFVGVGCWFYGRYSLRMSTALGRAMIFPVALGMVALGGLLAFAGLPSMSAQTESWEPFSEAALDQYRREGRNVFVDFTADWCLNCKFNEARVYSADKLEELIESKQVVMMKADLTRDGEEAEVIRTYMKRMGARSVPFMLLFPGDNPDQPHARRDLVGKDDVIGLFESLPDPVTE